MNTHEFKLPDVGEGISAPESHAVEVVEAVGERFEDLARHPGVVRYGGSDGPYFP